MSRTEIPAQQSPLPGAGLNIRRLAGALQAAGPPLLFGVRLWVSVCLALYVAFRLELDNAYWAGLTAALVCQPSLGASLRKGAFRMVGTAIGAVAIVLLTAFFPQDRAAFLIGLALWVSACTFAATLLRNFAAYAAALAGITAAVIATDELGAIGGPNGQAFTFAVIRVSEIWIGIVCAGVVLTLTDLGGARRRLAGQFAALAAETAGWLVGAFRLSGPEQAQTREARRALIGRVVAVDPIIDEAIGESSDLRYRSPILQVAVEGLFAALSGWRTVANHLERLPDAEGWQQAATILQTVPQELHAALAGDRTIWTTEPSRLRRLCGAAVRALTGLPARTPSLRLLADRTAEALLGLSRALDGLALLVDDQTRAVPQGGVARLHVPDWLPPFVNAGHVFAVIVAIELFWVLTGWPSGALAVTFATVGLVLFTPKADQAYAIAAGWLFGCGLSFVLAVIVKFAVLPQLDTFAGLSLAIGFVLVPAGALVAQPWRTGVFVAVTGNFIALLAPANTMNYDFQQFYNSGLGIVGGGVIAALSFLVLPALSPALRTRRLLTLSVRDLRRLARGAIPRTAGEWEGRIYSRLSVLPDTAEPVQRAQLVAALSVGTEIIRLRHIAGRFALGVGLDAALAALARGDSALATGRLSRLDRSLAALPDTLPGGSIRLRARGSILAISETLAQYPAYFDTGAAQ